MRTSRGDVDAERASGPDRPTFSGLTSAVRDAIGSHARIVGVPGGLVPVAARFLGLALRDTPLTRDEFRAMADGLADTDGPATGQISVTKWITENKDTLGRR
jgi:hypothetical protein